MEDTDSPASDGRDSDAAGPSQPDAASSTPTSQPDGDGAWFAPPTRFPPAHARAALPPPPVPFVASVAMPGAGLMLGPHEVWPNEQPLHCDCRCVCSRCASSSCSCRCLWRCTHRHECGCRLRAYS